MLKWFGFGHLPPHLQPVSITFSTLAKWMYETIPPGAEATEAMRKLLEAKDCAVRAFIEGTPTALNEPPPKQEEGPSDGQQD